MVLEHLKKFDDIITPTEFLEGQSGMCAVVHSNWIVNKSTDATAEVIVVLRREGDFWWWCICNSEAALALFNGGNFRYHKRAPYVLPTHLVALLKGGKQLVDTTNL